jgi:hypothetical protein
MTAGIRTLFSPRRLGADGLMRSFEEYVKQEDWSSFYEKET